MSSPLPERYQRYAAPGGQRAVHVDDTARRLLAAVEEAMATPTAYRDESPLPVVGDAPPAPQPGRPAMSPAATDASVMMLCGGAATFMVGIAAAGVMYVSQYANTLVCALVLGAPTALILAVARLMKSSKRAPDVYITGDVRIDQRTVRTSNRGVWAKTTNKPN